MIGYEFILGVTFTLFLTIFFLFFTRSRDEKKNARNRNKKSRNKKNDDSSIHAEKEESTTSAKQAYADMPESSLRIPPPDVQRIESIPPKNF